MWDLLFNFWYYLPWAVIGLMAGMALRSRRDSKALLLQALGAAGCFVIGCVQWVVVDVILFKMGGAGSTVFNAGRIIFSFLLFISLAIFALGYCIERFRRRRADAAAVEVKATPTE